MAKTAIFLATGFEEIEALTVVDLLRRVHVEIDMVSVTGEKRAIGSHGIAVEERTYTMEELWNADEVLVLTSAFEVGPDCEDGSLNPDSTYTDWLWIMVKDNNGWRHADHGY